MKKKVNPIINTFLLFLVCFVANGLLCSFTKKIMTYNDELYYYSFAHSLWDSGSIIVRQIPYFYHKILYCYLISPAFAIESASVRMLAISWINAFVMALSVFPAMGMIVRLLKDTRLRIFASALTITMPCLVYASSVMSEVLLYPLTVLFFYLIVLMEENRNSKNFITRLAPALGAGFVLYLLYWNKEICLYLVCGYIAYMFYHAVVAIIQQYKNPSPSKKSPGLVGAILSHESISILLQVLTVAGVFLVLYGLFETTAYSGMPNSYAGTVEQGGYPYARFGYTAYFGFYNLNYFIAAFGVLPVLLPLVLWRKMSHKARGLYLMLVSSLVMCIGAISFIISALEDAGGFNARLHLRYAEPLILIFWLLFLHLYEEHREVLVARSKAVALIVVSYLAIFVAFAFRFDDAHSFNTETALQGYSFLCNLLCSTGFLTEELASLLVRLLLAGFWGALAYCLIRKPSLFVRVMTIGVIALTLFNNACAYYTFHKFYAFSKAEAAIYDEADAYLKDLPGDVLFVVNQKEEKDAYLHKYIDTYIDRDFYFATIQQLDYLEDYSGGEFDLKELSIPTWIPYETSYTELTSVEYLISYGEFKVLDATEITDWPLASQGFHLWVPSDSSVLHFEYEYEDLYNEPENVMGMEMSL